MKKNNELRCLQCGNYFNPCEEKSDYLCKECAECIDEAFEKESEIELKEDYKKACEEVAGTRVLNEEEIFGKLSKAASDIVYEVEGYVDENRSNLTIEMNEVSKNKNRALLINITNGCDNVSVRYTMDYISDCPSEANTIELHVSVNEQDLYSYTIEHINGEVEFVDGGVPYPLTEEGIIFNGRDEFVDIVIELIKSTF